MKRNIEIENFNFSKESDESDSEFGEEELDPEIVKVIDELYLKDIDRKLRAGKDDEGRHFDLVKYFKEAQSALSAFEENNQNYPHDVEMGRIYFSSVLVTEASCLRLKNEARKNKENLALREAKWYLDLASYYWTFKEDPKVAHIVKMCMDRFQKTRKILGYSKEDTQGMVRGFKGLLGFMNALDKNEQELRLPTPKQDAEEKIDLFSVDSRGNYIAWQIKTIAQKENVDTEKASMHDIDPAMRKLANSAQKLEKKSGLTIKPMCINIPEHLIKDNFEPEKTFVNNIKGIGDNHE